MTLSELRKLVKETWGYCPHKTRATVFVRDGVIIIRKYGSSRHLQSTISSLRAFNSRYALNGEVKEVKGTANGYGAIHGELHINKEETNHD